MNILDKEVTAVITGILVVASVLAASSILRGDNIEPFQAIGILNENCLIGEYPDYAFLGENLDLCILLVNYEGYPVIFQVRYKLGDETTIPTNTTPSPLTPLKTYEKILNNKENATLKIKVPIPEDRGMLGRKALIFELWVYNYTIDKWVYTGKWAHIYIDVREAPIP